MSLEAIQLIIDEMTEVAASKDDSALPEWTSENRATIDAWQSRLRDALASSALAK